MIFLHDIFHASKIPFFRSETLLNRGVHLASAFNQYFFAGIWSCFKSICCTRVWTFTKKTWRSRVTLFEKWEDSCSIINQRITYFLFSLEWFISTSQWERNTWNCIRTIPKTKWRKWRSQNLRRNAYPSSERSFFHKSPHSMREKTCVVWETQY